MQVPLPNDEFARLAALRRSRALESMPDASFIWLTTLAAKICNAPMAAITLVDAEQLRFKAQVGFTAKHAPRETGFCGYSILQSGVMIVPDAVKDARFTASPLVTGELQVRFYAGAPLVTEEGHMLGALCVLDRQPRELTAIQVEALCAFSQQIVSQIELQRSQLELAETLVQQSLAEQRLRAIVEGTARTVGRDFFRSMVRFIAEALSVKIAFVTECANRQKTRARLLAFWEGKGFASETEYDLKNTPCENVYGNETCFYASGLQRLFPADTPLAKLNGQSYIGLPMQDSRGELIGHLAVIDDVPMDEARGLDVMKIFAARAGAELERLNAEAKLREALREVERLKNQLQAENLYLQEEILREHNFEEIIGTSPALLDMLQQLRRAAPTDATILILGETGTGKELLAHAIHQLSARRERPLVKVNCGAISAGLVESELFGHVKGAFTGALDKRIGRFELADGGTLLLDEVGELPMETQVKLLRVLQEGEFEPVGSSKTTRVNVRIVAATNRDLAAEVAAGRFRADLFYRLNVLPLRNPSLRERREDIPALAAFFAARFAHRFNRQIEGIAPATLELLRQYHWPGNIRELQNVIERAVVLATGSILTIAPNLFSDAPAMPPHQVTPAITSTQSLPARGASLTDIERQHISATLRQTGWVIEGDKGAAKILNLPPGTLRSRMKKLGIQRPA